MLIKFKNNRSECDIIFAQKELTLHSSGVIYWPAEKTLILSDLHLEKGSYYAALGLPIPIYDTLYTLEAMQYLLDIYRPQRVICLGDNIHDPAAIWRMQKENYQLLYDLCERVNEWYWIIGNHDSHGMDFPIFKNFRVAELFCLQEIIFSHLPLTTSFPQIIGHFHPKYTTIIHAQKITGKCFISNDRILVMPSFGIFTGGLDISAEAFKKLPGGNPQYCYFIKKDKIWLLPYQLNNAK